MRHLGIDFVDTVDALCLCMYMYLSCLLLLSSSKLLALICYENNLILSNRSCFALAWWCIYFEIGNMNTLISNLITRLMYSWLWFFLSVYLSLHVSSMFFRCQKFYNQIGCAFMYTIFDFRFVFEVFKIWLANINNVHIRWTETHTRSKFIDSRVPSDGPRSQQFKWKWIRFGPNVEWERKENQTRKPINKI